MPIAYHLVAAILVAGILLFLVLKGLNTYTRHNKAVVIPDVKGMQIREAALFFENNGLRYSVIDSIYSKEVPSGAIVDVFPVVGSKVKEGRIVSLTLNAADVEKAAIPDVADMSFRQAQAVMQAQGFSFMEIRYVPGTYRDLAVAVEWDGKELKPGDSVPLSSTLVLKVSDGGRDASAESESDSAGNPVSENQQ
jgi:beta-lactam-binding protein with PASTA domain